MAAIDPIPAQDRIFAVFATEKLLIIALLPHHVLQQSIFQRYLYRADAQALGARHHEKLIATDRQYVCQ